MSVQSADIAGLPAVTTQSDTEAESVASDGAAVPGLKGTLCLDLTDINAVPSGHELFPAIASGSLTPFIIHHFSRDCPRQVTVG